MAKANGYWGDPAFPKRGWTLINCADYGSPPSFTCEMCQVQAIRYVHYVEHPEEQYDLRVGCVCASKMLGGSDLPRRVETKLRLRAHRKDNWLGLKGWRVSARGNDYIVKDDMVIVVYGGHGRASFMVDGNRSDDWFQTEREAKLAAFDVYWEHLEGTFVPKKLEVCQPSSSIDWVLGGSV